MLLLERVGNSRNTEENAVLIGIPKRSSSWLQGYYSCSHEEVPMRAVLIGDSYEDCMFFSVLVIANSPQEEDCYEECQSS